jgi:hypothetical protein
MLQKIKNIAKEQRHNDFFWRYGFNLRPSVNYKLNSPTANDNSAAKVIENLNRDGIAVTSIDELLADKKPFAELETAVENLLESRRDELREIKSKAGDANLIGAKTFNVELLGSKVEFDAESVFARFALQETFLNIANAYFGMLVKLRYYNVWQTFATVGEARESQLWHFDREDNYILKLFLYLKDVDEGAGPFTYAPKTHRKGKLWGNQPEFSLEQNVMRSTDEQMSAVVPKENWVRGIGKKGTIIFADTRGFHKGGEARTDDRLMFTAMFTSPASDSKRLLLFNENSPLAHLTKKQICALEIK